MKGKLMLAVPNYIANNRVLVKGAAKLSKHSPEICLVGGIALGVGATVMACRSTLKVAPIIQTHKDNLDKINTTLEDIKKHPEEYEPMSYSDEDAQHDKFISTVQCGVGLAKLYLPSILLGATSIALICISHNIMVKRNAALAATVTAVQTAFDEYRKRVATEIGEEREKDIYNGRMKVVEEVKDEKGKTKKEEKIVQKRPIDPYARVFDEYNPWWSEDAEHNKFFLCTQESRANDLLRRHGFLFLNDVYKMLGFDCTPEGAVCGWILDSETGDGFVDFGIWNEENAQKVNFINCFEKSIWLTFNVDGVMYDKI